MQISNGDNNINVTMNANSVSTSGNNSWRKKVLTTFVFLLLLCFLLVSSVTLFISLDGPNTIRDSALGLLKTNVNSSLDSTEKPREYNEATLSYFSPTELAKLGILPLPNNFKVQEEYKGIKLVQSETEKFTDLQLALLKMFIDTTPQKLLEPGPTAIVTFKKGEIKQGTNFNPNTAAFASGSYVFFNDNSFDPNTPLADDSIDAAYNTFIHELTHVSQFNEINQDISRTRIDSNYELGQTWIDLVMNSDLIADFASISGWEKKEAGEKITYTLKDETQKTSQYGKSKIYEDMAETVAGVVTTEDYEFSTQRKSWAVKYLDEDLASLSKEKLPFNESLEQVKANNLQYDSSKENVYKNNYQHTSKQVFVTQRQNSLDEIYNYFNQEIGGRGWKGNFKKTVEPNNVVRYKGDFDGVHRDMYVEIYSYDKATGYLVKPKGTIVVVVSGYIKKTTQ